VRIDGGGGTAAEANFLIGLCSFGRLPDPQSFVYVPKAANLLREREQHVQLLDQQLARTKKWLAEMQAERDSLLGLYHRQADELMERTIWAERVDAELADLIEVLTKERQQAEALTQAYDSRLAHLEAENVAKTEWAQAAEARLQESFQQLTECLRLLEATEATVVERTLWAQRTEKLREDLAAQMDLIRRSRWVRLGRKFGLGPIL
jgi:hypothetical protein